MRLRVLFTTVAILISSLVGAECPPLGLVPVPVECRSVIQVQPVDEPTVPTHPQPVAECSVVVPIGAHDIRLESYYAHKSVTGPGLAEDTLTQTAVGPVVASAISHRAPIGHRWWVDGQHALTCGELLLFEHDFETGTTYRWAHTVGG